MIAGIPLHHKTPCTPTSQTPGYTVFLKEQLLSNSDGRVFIPELNVGGDPLSYLGKGTVCSVLCGDGIFPELILFVRQGGTFDIHLILDSEYRHVCLKASPLIEQRI